MQSLQSLQLKWVIPRRFDTSEGCHGGVKWKNNFPEYAEKILMYSLDGVTWNEVPYEYLDVPEGEYLKYKWIKPEKF